MNHFEALSKQLADLLIARGLTVCTAESCTGGGISYALTSLAGSSAWFDRAYITYSNKAKMDMLGVNPGTLETYGAVSEETAHEMVSGAVQRSGTDLGVAVTGIAGPGGATPSKPVGTVSFGWCLAEILHTKTHVFPGDRTAVRDATIKCALEGLIELVI